MKKILLSMAAAAICIPAFAAEGDVTTILDQTFAEGTTLEDTDAYTWGSEIQGMIKANGLYVTNASNKANNYENRDFITFANPLGSPTSEVNISYKLYNPKDKGQANTYYSINYFNADGDFVFGIQEASGNWAYSANIVTANADGTTSTIALPTGHMSKGGGSTVNVTVKFSDTNAIVAIDGGNYDAYTKSEGIKYVKLSVSGENGYDRDMYVKNYVVKTTEVAAAQFADYTLKYVVGEEIIKEVTKSGEVGTSISLASNEIENFYNEDETVKYIYVSNDAEGQTVNADGTTVVTITFREAAKYNYIVTNNVTDKTVEGTCFEGNNATVSYCRYILSENGEVWLKEPCGGDKKLEYNYVFTPNSDNFKVTLDYTKYAEDGIFYIEAEDIEGVTKVTNNNADVRCSDAAGAYTGEEAITICTLEPGKYTIETAIMGGKSGDTDVIFTVAAGEENVVEAVTNGSWHTQSGEIELTVPTDITVKGGAGNKPFDYVLITGTVDTGSAVKGVEVAEDNVWYNLQGVKIAEPTQKGLFIHNGKKVIVK